MGFAREDTHKLKEMDITTFTRTCIGAKLSFTGTGLNEMTELQTNWWLDCVETLKSRSDIKDLGEMCIWLGTNFPRKTPENIGRSLLEELGRCLDKRLTLSDKELQAERYGSDIGTDEHDLQILGKYNGGKSALFNLKDTDIL